MWWTLLAVLGRAAEPEAGSAGARSFLLDNGLRVVIEADPGASVVASALRIEAGAAMDQAVGAAGAAHLLEHLMFEGSASAPGEAYDDWLSAAGGDSNAWTSQDATVFTAVVPSEALELLLFLEADRLAWLTPGAEGLENQRDVVLAELARDADTPGGLAGAARAAAQDPAGHPYRTPAGGTAAGVRAAGLDAVEALYSAWYRPDNASLVLVGALDLDLAEAAVRRWFGEVPSTTAPLPERRAAPPEAARGRAGERRLTWLADVAEPELVVQWPTVPAGHPDEAALDLLAGVLGGAPGSRLRPHLAGRRSLPRSLRGVTVTAWTENRRLDGSLVVRVRSLGGGLGAALGGLDEVITGLARSPVTADEVSREQRRWVAWAARAAEDPQDRAGLISECLALAGSPDCLAARVADRLAVTPEDVARVAGKWLLPDRRVVLGIVPETRPERALPGASTRPRSRPPRSALPRPRAHLPMQARPPRRLRPRWSGALSPTEHESG